MIMNTDMTQTNIKQLIKQLTVECQELLAQIKIETLTESEKASLVQKLEDTAHQLLPLLENYPNEEARKIVVSILKQRLARLEVLSDTAILKIDRKINMLDQIVTNLEKKSRTKIN